MGTVLAERHVTDDEQQALAALAMIRKGLDDIERLQATIAADHRRARIFRRLGVRVPRFLYWLHHWFLEPRWAKRERWYHRAGLAVVRWWIDRFEMLEYYGRLW